MGTADEGMHVDKESRSKQATPEEPNKATTNANANNPHPPLLVLLRSSFSSAESAPPRRSCAFLPSPPPSIDKATHFASFSLLPSLSCPLCIKLFVDFASFTHKRPPSIPETFKINENNDHHIEQKRNEEKPSFAPLLYTETITADEIGGGLIHHHARTKPKHYPPPPQRDRNAPPPNHAKHDKTRMRRGRESKKDMGAEYKP